MQTRLISRISAVLMAACLLLAAAAPVLAAGPSRVVVLPFTANSKEDISFVVKGMRDMLASRLPWQDKVTVVEPDLVAPVLAKVKPPYNDAKARQIGKDLSANVVVYGSITKLGKSVSVDARVVKVDQAGPALTAYVHAKDLDAVIPQINSFAQRINAEIFKRPDAIAAQKQAAAPAKTASGGGSSGMDKLPANISPLNPLFLKQLSGVESDRYWRSPRLNGIVQSVAVADIDNDGKNELLVLFKDRMRFYRLSGDAFRLMYEFKNGPTGEYLFVDCADIDGNGRPEIYVSNRNFESVESFVLEWSEGGPHLREKDVAYYLRVQQNPLGKGHWLLGQQSAVDSPFWGPVYKMQVKGGKVVEERVLKLPDTAWLYNFVLADLNQSGRLYTVLIGPTMHLRVYNDKNQQMWISGETYNASSKFLKYMALQGTDYDSSWWYLLSRLYLTDLNKDGRHEILCLQVQGRMGMVMDHTRMIYQGTILGMSWNGLSMIEDWRTPRISGDVTDYVIGDVGNVGRPALVLSFTQKVFGGMIEKGVSNVVAFTLKPSTQKRKAPKNKGL
ncbi:MAG: VCBS repeat-containing protein [Desulfarculaceae bacterium]|nr:VCBS repeat-containing protein [Desulfarculaceae bacterium]MCF8073104.1 VCBS repeat-containing protein [Desulfarculaceae bacterium]MCF8101811.1 VCBS repeat-containing protein [Desulfarculaceae bacterium]MCF8117375.1 VCBS repeat-containing protein [Desulfarculaceae bacterium]